MTTNFLLQSSIREYISGVIFLRCFGELVGYQSAGTTCYEDNLAPLGFFDIRVLPPMIQELAARCQPRRPCEAQTIMGTLMIKEWEFEERFKRKKG